jgi:excisionase family DNA binding protein
MFLEASVKITRTTRAEDLPEWLTVHEAAAWLGTSAGTIYAMVQRADLHGVRVGRLLRIPRAALVDLSGTPATK